MPGKGGRFLQMRSCNTERYAFGGEEFRICEQEKRVGEGGDAVGGRFCIESLVPSVCVPEGAKKEHSKDHKSSTTF